MVDVRNWISKHEAHIEKYTPFASGCITGALACLILPDITLKRALDQLPNLLVNVSAITVGFLATFRGILISARDTSFMLRFRTKAKKHYERFQRYLDEAIFTSFLLAVFSSILSLVDINNGLTIFLRLGISSWLGFAMYVATNAYRTAYITSRVMFYLEKEENSN